MKKIMILEPNAELVSELKSCIANESGMSVCYAGDDGEVGARKAIEQKPDLIMVNMFLKGLDGCMVIRDIRKADAKIKILATGFSNENLIQQAMDEGADYYLIKPFTLSSVVERMQELLKDRTYDVKDFAAAKKKSVSLDEKISDIFISIGIPPHIKGYSYLREGIKKTVDEPNVINHVTKVLYPSIAKNFDTTPSKVERAIRHAIEVAWNRGRIDAINAIFGSRVYLGSEKPTNSEFIALVADKLILENLI